MDPFDWTKDKAIYQRWHLWLEQARLTLDAMESEKKLRFLTFTIGSMEKEWDILSHGKTTKSMMD